MDSPSPPPQDQSDATVGVTPQNWKRDHESEPEKTIQPGSSSASPDRNTSSAKGGREENTSRSHAGRPVSSRARSKKRVNKGKHHVTLEKTDDQYTDDRYLELGELGRGGWGVVGRVYDRQLQREVAVKRIRSSENITPLEHSQFLHEARVTSRLQHPGVVPIHELATDPNGETFYVMKLLEGDTLRHHIRLAHQDKPAKGWNRHDLVVAITPLLLRFVDVCNAVSYAHRNGIIHRDLKPTNVMAGAFGETIVVDWGLARDANPSSHPQRAAAETNCGVIHPESHTTKSSNDAIEQPYRSSRSRSTAPPETEGSVIGTPSYMAPEQARGELSEMGIHSDIYALGGILYEIVAGKNAHAGLDVKTVLHRAQKGVTTPLAETQPTIPAALAEIVNTALAFEPNDRYRTAEQLADDVQRFVTGERVKVYQETALEKGIRWCRRNRSTALSIATASVILLMGSIFSSIVIRSAHRAEKESRIRAELAHKQALSRLIDARDAADTWLVELSGATQFHPAMAPIRQELFERATRQYQTLLDEPIAPLPASSSQTTLNAVSKPDQTTLAAEWLERAKCHIRLGDLQRLSGNSKLLRDQAAKHYRSAQRILAQISAPATRVQTVSLNVDANHRVRQDWKTRTPVLSTSIQLESINAQIGEILNGLPTDTSQRLVLIRERLDSWIPWQPPTVDLSKRKRTTANTFAYRAISARARLELALARSQGQSLARSQGQSLGQSLGQSPASYQHLDRLHHAAQWARWLAIDRGLPKDLQLYEQIQTQLAQTLQDANRLQDANESWSELIEEILSRDQSTGVRSDWMQTLAFARMQRAEIQATLGMNDQASDGYHSAIKDLESAWALTDKDAFFRTNLATAELNLAQLLPAANEVSRQQAMTLISRSIATYRQLLQESATPSTLHRLADGHWLMVKLIDQSTGQSASEEENEMLIEHLNRAKLALTILSDQNELSGDGKAILEKVSQRLASLSAESQDD